MAAMWYWVFGTLLALAAGCVLYVVSRVRKFAFVGALAGGRRGRRWAVAALCTGVALALATALLGVVNAIIAVLHLAAFWAVSELLFCLVRRIRGRDSRRYVAGAVALAFTALYLAAAWFAAHRVTATRYCIDAPGQRAALRIVQLSDAHVGALFDADGFAARLARIQDEEPDAVVITGDFVDDDTSREDMLSACAALGRLKTTYGVFFSYGNHDRGYYDAQRRGWTAGELEQALIENRVIVLTDQTARLGADYCLIGRDDASNRQRMSMDALMAQTEPGRFVIVLDHQPDDYDAQAAAGVGLVLSGHTHGGQLFPATLISRWLRVDDRVYGHEQRGDSHFIVSSGIADWAIGFKTGCVSEYVVVDIR